MISFEEASLLLHKWAEESTLLRFDGKSLLYSFSLEGTLESFNDGVLRFRLGDAGYIEVHVPRDSGFGYFDPDSMRTDPAERIGKGHKGESVTTGAGIWAIKKTGEELLLIEIVRREKF